MCKVSLLYLFALRRYHRRSKGGQLYAPPSGWLVARRPSGCRVKTRLSFWYSGCQITHFLSFSKACLSSPRGAMLILGKDAAARVVSLRYLKSIVCCAFWLISIMIDLKVSWPWIEFHRGPSGTMVRLDEINTLIVEWWPQFCPSNRDRENTHNQLRQFEHLFLVIIFTVVLLSRVRVPHYPKSVAPPLPGQTSSSAFERREVDAWLFLLGQGRLKGNCKVGLYIQRYPNKN